jgi:hypothetical protein
MVLMSEDLPEPRCDEISSVASTACVIHDTHLTHNKNSEPVNNGTAVIMTVSTASDHAPKVVGKQALQSGRETWSAFVLRRIPSTGSELVRWDFLWIGAG